MLTRCRCRVVILRCFVPAVCPARQLVSLASIWGSGGQTKKLGRGVGRETIYKQMIVLLQTPVHIHYPTQPPVCNQPCPEPSRPDPLCSEPSRRGSVGKGLACVEQAVLESSGQLRASGFTRKQLASLLSNFVVPSLKVDLQSVCRCVAALTGAGLSPGLVCTLAMHHPALFTFDVAKSKLKHNLRVFETGGVGADEVGKILLQFPVLFTSSLTSDAGEGIRRLRELRLLKAGTLRTALDRAHKTRPPKLKMDLKAKLTCKLLADLQVDTGGLLLKCPRVFEQSAAHLNSLIEVLSSAPLYLGSEDIKLFFSRYPHLILEALSARILEAHIVSLASFIPKSHHVRKKVLHVPKLISPRVDVSARLGLLRQFGFSTPQQYIKVLEVCPSLLTLKQEDLIQKLKLFCSLPGATPELILDSSFARLLTHRRYKYLQDRVKYAERHVPNLLHMAHFDKLFISSEEEFARECSKSDEPSAI